MRRLGTMAVVAQVVMVGLLVGIAAAARTEFPNPPEPVPRALALGLLFVLPAIVGGIGVAGRDRALLAAAAILTSAGSVLAFSGVTLIFLAPALIFAVAAGEPEVPPSSQRRPLVVTALVLLIGSVIVTVAVLKLGIFTLPLLGVLLLAASLARIRPIRVPVGSALVVTAVVAAGIGAGLALFGMTETRCWQARQTETGIEYQIVPESAMSGPMGGDIIAAGCDSGVFTVRGAGIAAVLGLCAVGVAAARAARS